MTTTHRKPPRTIIGVVTSDKMHKTIVVQATRRVRHELYGKTMTKRRVMKAHDEKNEAHVGARVRIAATRPLSKTKRWRLVEVIEQGPEE